MPRYHEHTNCHTCANSSNLNRHRNNQTHNCQTPSHRPANNPLNPYIPFIILATIILFNIRACAALYGFDCASGKNSILKVSLNEVGECNIAGEKVQNVTTYMQLLQLTDYANTHIKSCQVTIHRQISHCGMSSHASMVKSGTGSYIKDITRDQCEEMHRTGTFQLNDIKFENLKSNTTIRASETLAGSVNSNGNCHGGYYKDPYGEWENVVVIADIKISLRDYEVKIHLNKEQIITSNGLHCPLKDGKCTDHTGGTLFWEPYPIESCRYDKYTVIHEGPALKMQTVKNNLTSTIISVESKDITFAFSVTASDMVCGYLLSKTEHPKLFILEGQKGTFFKANSRVKTHDLDLFNYINSKFVYTEKYTKRQMNSLYHDVITKRCELERKVLQNSLALAIVNPDQFAATYMRAPGYTAIITGEVIQIIKCTKVEVTLAPTERCYQELPVLQDGEVRYLSPRTRLLKRRGFEIDCNIMLPSTYEIDGQWYKMIPRAVETPSPEIIKPDTMPTWRYQSPMYLAKAGIYSANDLQRLTDYIMQPSEQAAIVNVFARLSTGRDTDTRGMYMANFLDTNALNEIAKSTWNKMWGWFSNIGVTSAGILGVYFIIRFIKLCVDIAIHMFTLHSVYGWSVYLLGAIWDSITNLLIYLGRNRRHPPGAPPAILPANAIVDVALEPNNYVEIEPARPPRRARELPIPIQNEAACV